MTRINSHNEWDRLREIIVGRAESQAALVFRGSDGHFESKLEKAQALAKQAFPQWLVDEINEDLEELSNVLRSFDVKVHRPNANVVGSIFKTPSYAAVCDQVYNMRDLHLVVGDTVVESPSQEKSRYFEATGLYDIWYEYFNNGGFRWIAGPKPRLNTDYMQVYYEGGRDHYQDGQKFIRLTEDEILFEAANTVRMGRDLLYLVSRSGNNIGAKWLQSVLGDDYRVHTTSAIYKSSHIDSTVLCLRPGLVLLNASRVNDDNMPAILGRWDKIMFSDIAPTPESTLKFHAEVRKPVHEQLLTMGVESNVDAIASPWIGLNVLSVDPNTVIVDKRQTGVIKVLEQHKITPVPISFRHSYYMGGIHCSTLDTVRDSKLESVFD